MKILRLATRKSALALWQSEHVAARLRAAHPGLEVQLVPMSTRGDQVLDRSLAAIGGKGLFLKELEVAMLAGAADAAVHSLKDVPMQLDAPFTLAAILERADPFDALVSNHYDSLSALPAGARVGTSALRRQAQLRACRPDLQLLDLRGNVNTRLARLDDGGFDAIILACAGLQRLGFSQRIRSRLIAPQWLPAVAQGAIAIESRADASAVIALLAGLDHRDSRRCVEAERAMNRALHGSCHVPVAAHATLSAAGLHLVGLVGDVATGKVIRAEADAAADQADALGQRVADALFAQGAGALLQAYVSE
ncbi:MAG: hydroxymethylbilane synthase [Lysobacterales bacterium CG17_big_fil_post_rev_8_21_14_2_50_64_11]|nr:MAG: hydroxymethylbilane synthase [Xanthomonadales bacterium CG17_big_fil_post_rev_8_21_14_2_50_64_11]PIX59615.1 MAG: hydroxymethylbilane synthase [Xanthomonadales bacterium CG_4_10_14_3_um_filter_64_11]